MLQCWKFKLCSVQLHPLPAVGEQLAVWWMNRLVEFPIYPYHEEYWCDEVRTVRHFPGIFGLHFGTPSQSSHNQPWFFRSQEIERSTSSGSRRVTPRPSSINWKRAFSRWTEATPTSCDAKSVWRTLICDLWEYGGCQWGCPNSCLVAWFISWKIPI